MIDRTRSEYRRPLPLDMVVDATAGVHLRGVGRDDRRSLAVLLLDAYRGTIDDEGEDLDDALAAADELLGVALPDHSFGSEHRGRLVAVSLVCTVGDTHYVDMVAVAADAKRRGLGRRVVGASLASLATAGAGEVGAVITDGNTPSEELFASLGFHRVGAWPPA